VFLLDSHIVLWVAFDPERLSKRAASEIREARARGEALAISAATLYEFALTVARGRVNTSLSLDHLLGELPSLFEVLPLTAEVAASAATMPVGFPRDPFDRIIAATALINGLQLITADREIRKSQVVSTIW